MAQQSDYLAKPSGQCCLQGSLHQGEPRGEHVTVAGVETYIARPTAERANNHILLYFPDVWGFFNNGFLIMDGFADAGYLTLGLDYFRGVRLCLVLSFLAKVCSSYQSRTRYGSIERTVMTAPTRTLITKHGSKSILPSPTRRFLRGLRLSSPSSEKQTPSMLALGSLSMSAVGLTQLLIFALQILLWSSIRL